MRSKARSRRKVHTKDRIVDTAFRIVRKRGLGALSAREIARAMKASTMPIYSSIASMRTVRREVRARAVRLLREYQAKPYTDNIHMNMALGYIDFARREKPLFRLLFLDLPKTASAVLREEAEAAGAGMGLSGTGPVPKDLEDLAFRMWVFMHGLAMLVHSGSAAELDDTRILALLSEAGTAFRKHL
jgi:AcrR family transcriptional regulator